MEVAHGPLTSHRVRFDGQTAIVGSLEDGRYRIRFERSGHSLLVAPRFLEDLGVPEAKVIDQWREPEVEVEPVVQAAYRCGGRRDPEDVVEQHFTDGPGPYDPAYDGKVFCSQCQASNAKFIAKVHDEAKAAKRRSRKVSKSRKHQRRDRFAHSATYGQTWS